jgi:hypothetical protein
LPLLRVSANSIAPALEFPGFHKVDNQPLGVRAGGSVHVEISQSAAGIVFMKRT